MDGESNSNYNPGNLAVGGLRNGEPVDGGQQCPCDINGPPVHFNSPRIGAWDSDADGVMDRSMRGQIAVFRLWDKIKNGEVRCIPSGNEHLVVNYLFDSFNDVLKDRSGNGNDAVLHDTKFSADYPDQHCIFNTARLSSLADPVVVGMHGTATVGCSDCEGSGETSGAHQPPVDICLNEAFANPVIIAGVPTENGPDSTVVRIQNLRRAGEYAQASVNVGSVQYGDNCDGADCGHTGRRCGCQWCFDMFLQEPECLDQWHADEEVSWIAVEAGAWVNNAGDGGFQAGTTPAQGAIWEYVALHANSGNDHAIMTHVQTTHDPHFVKTRQQAVTKDGFEVMLEQTGQSSEVGDINDDCDDTTCTAGTTYTRDTSRQVSEHIHGFETVGWLAVAVGVGQLGNVHYEAGVTAEEVTHLSETVNFRHAFEQPPRFFANIMTHNGWVRRTIIAAMRVAFFLECQQ